MIHDLESLLGIQKIDIKISQLIQSQADFPKNLADLEDTVSKAKSFLDTIAKKIASLETDKKTIQDKVIEAKTALDRSQDRLNSIKTNREYDAVHAEIENFKNVISGADNKIKHIDEEREKQNQALEAATIEYEKVKSDNQGKINEFKGKLSTIDSSIAALNVERVKACADVPKPALRTYEHILKRKKNGKVLSFITIDSHTCTNCFKVLETQLINEIRRGSKIMTCQNCGSIFIWENTAENPEASKLK